MRRTWGRALTSREEDRVALDIGDRLLGRGPDLVDRRLGVRLRLPQGRRRKAAGEDDVGLVVRVSGVGGVGGQGGRQRASEVGGKRGRGGGAERSVTGGGEGRGETQSATRQGQRVGEAWLTLRVIEYMLCGLERRDGGQGGRESTAGW